tara:strand:+ start:238 stop:342 length:105 start_codon:yes stop_codon:yes gene_type:complete
VFAINVRINVRRDNEVRNEEYLNSGKYIIFSRIT